MILANSRGTCRRSGPIDRVLQRRRRLRSKLTLLWMGFLAAFALLLCGCSTGGGSGSASASSSKSASGAGPITVAATPRRAAATVSQKITLSATTNDGSGVSWSISPSGASINPGSSLSGASVTLTAPSSAGTYTLTATSMSAPSVTSSITLAVTDLGGVYTYHNDLSRDGANTHEYALTSASVTTSSFGKLFSCTVDGAVYAQPLWVANLNIGGTAHNVVVVATEHDSLFVIDADMSPCVTLWSVSLIDTHHGASAAETPVPSGVAGALVGNGSGDIAPEIGVTGTPVIDPATGIVYVVSKSVVAGTSNIQQRLHAIDIITGSEKPGSPVTISATYPGTGDGGTVVSFNTQQENQRPGLALINGSVYIGWSAHEDDPPFYGWLMAYSYNGSALTQTSVFNVAPNATQGGIWMGGGAPAADSANNLYVVTGDGTFDANSGGAPNNDYGDTLLKMTGNLAVSQYFTPSDEQSDAANDIDFGAGGAALLADLPAGSPVSHLVIAGGKDGSLYVVNRDAMGGLGDSNAWQKLNFNWAIFGTAAYWNNYFYLSGAGSPLYAYLLNTSTALFSPVSNSTATFGYPGSTPSVSAAGNGNGIVWILDNSNYCTSQSPACGPTILHAFNATNVGAELWNSAMVSADAAGYAIKFTVPTIANGKIYVGTRGNNAGGLSNSTAVPGELDVYGLKPN